MSSVQTGAGGAEAQEQEAAASAPAQGSQGAISDNKELEALLLSTRLQVRCPWIIQRPAPRGSQATCCAHDPAPFSLSTHTLF